MSIEKNLIDRIEELTIENHKLREENSTLKNTISLYEAKPITEFTFQMESSTCSIILANPCRIFRRDDGIIDSDPASVKIEQIKQVRKAIMKMGFSCDVDQARNYVLAMYAYFLGNKKEIDLKTLWK